MSEEKSFQYVKIILPLFRAVVKFYSDLRLSYYLDTMTSGAIDSFA